MFCLGKRSRCLLIGASAVALLAGSPTTQAADSAGPYKVQRTWKIGGDGGWDYLTVDSAAKRLYIARGNRVQIVDLESGKLTAEITWDLKVFTVLPSTPPASMGSSATAAQTTWQYLTGALTRSLRRLKRAPIRTAFCSSRKLKESSLSTDGAKMPQ